MDFEYHYKGDILYQVENYKFRFQGNQTAEVELLILDNNQFAYEVEIIDGSVPNRLCEFTSASIDFKQDLNIETPSVFYDKQEALQDAINVISIIMTNHSDKQIFDEF